MLTSKMKLSALSDPDLDALTAVAFNVWDFSKELGSFVADILTDESMRRLTGGDEIAVEIPNDWPSESLGSALLATQSFEVAAVTPAARTFASQLTGAVTAAAAARLTST